MLVMDGFWKVFSILHILGLVISILIFFLLPIYFLLVILNFMISATAYLFFVILGKFCFNQILKFIICVLLTACTGALVIGALYGFKNMDNFYNSLFYISIYLGLQFFLMDMVAD